MQNIHQTLTTLNPITLDSGQVFSGKPSGKQIRGYAKPSAYTPAIDPDYIFHESSRDVAVWFCNPTEPLYVFGPVGAGKTSLIKQLAARLNYPVFEVTGHGRLEFADLAGHLTVQNGSMAFEYGPLALAMRYGGILLFNEIDLTSPEVAAGLNSVLDGSPLCIAENGGELLTPHPMFRFVAPPTPMAAVTKQGCTRVRRGKIWLLQTGSSFVKSAIPHLRLSSDLCGSAFHPCPESCAGRW